MGSFEGNERCIALVVEGLALVKRGDPNRALDRFEAARHADPSASSPHSYAASAMHMAAEVALRKEGAGSKSGLVYTREARKMALRALAIEETDPVALLVLGKIASGPSPPRFPWALQAEQLLSEASALYQAKRFDQAGQLYDEAARADPRCADAFKFAGNSYMSAGRLDVAERALQRAVELAPLDAQAWRFLSGLHGLQQRADDAEGALFAALEADPGYFPAWGDLSARARAQGRPLRPLVIWPRAWLSDAKQITIDDEASEAEKLVWMGYAVGKQQILVQGAKGPASIEAMATAMMLALLNPRLDALVPDIAALGRLVKEAGLEACVFVLMYRAEFRAEFEAWKKSGKGRVRSFIETHRRRPY